MMFFTLLDDMTTRSSYDINSVRTVSESVKSLHVKMLVVSRPAIEGGGSPETDEKSLPLKSSNYPATRKLLMKYGRHKNCLVCVYNLSHLLFTHHPSILYLIKFCFSHL